MLLPCGFGAISPVEHAGAHTQTNFGAVAVAGEAKDLDPATPDCGRPSELPTIPVH